ncbi:uncharacterized protein LOC129940925 [Eupeodes corollae]|uniref:uncharacterized protein LOC129940925 n=1 Tax=Eupeodes corollae TaxID=290404 RepID=UPI002492EFD6|nr:uncharacterized protein LOC129940925 [Eupeodes corollae]
MLIKAFRNSYTYDAMSAAHKEKLIDLVKLNPGLWRQSRKAPGLKQKLWDSIGIELGTTGYDARRQWEILRDQLRRENKCYKQNPNYKSKWMFYTKMLFTLPQKDTPASLYSDDGEQYQSDQKMQTEEYQYLIPKTEEAPSIIQVRKDLQEQISVMIDAPSHQPSVDEFNPSPLATTEIVDDYYPSTSAGVSSSTQIPSFASTKVIELCETTRKSRNKRYPDDCPSQPLQLSPLEEDDDYYFAMSLVPSLRLIPRTKKLRVRSKMMDLIAAALEDDDYEEENVRVMNIEREEKIIHDHVMLHQTSMKKN